VRPHWLNGLGGAVNRFTGGTQIETSCDTHHSEKRPACSREPTREAATAAFAKSWRRQ
jgi:hypothetical protein